MNKKQYIAPAMVVCQLAPEGMIAASLIIGDDSGNQQLSNDSQGGWNSDAWADADNEDNL